MEIQRIAPDNGNVPKRDIIGHLIVTKHLFTGPFINAPGTRTRTPESGCLVMCNAVIGPFDRDLSVVLFDYLDRFDHKLLITGHLAYSDSLTARPIAIGSIA